MNKYLIIVAGPPATGKSYLVGKLVALFDRSVVISPDELKIDLAESEGFNNLLDKEKLDRKMWNIFYQLLILYMQAGRRHIIIEYPFSGKQREQLNELVQVNNYQPITIRLRADFEVLWQRRIERDLDNSRHLSLIMNEYHYGDTLGNRMNADALITRDEFRNIIQTRGYNHFQLGELIDLDVTDYSRVNYEEILRYVKQIT